MLQTCTLKRGSTGVYTFCEPIPKPVDGTGEEKTDNKGTEIPHGAALDGDAVEKAAADLHAKTLESVGPDGVSIVEKSMQR